MNKGQSGGNKSESATIDLSESHASANSRPPLARPVSTLQVAAHQRSIILKIVLVALLGLVVISLFSGLFFVYKDKGNSKRAVNALTLRIALSILIIIIVIASYFLGLLPPK